AGWTGGALPLATGPAGGENGRVPPRQEPAMSAPPAGLPRLARVARALLLLGLAGALIVPWRLVSARGLLHPPGEAQAVAREFFEAWRDGDQPALARLCGPTAGVDMAGSGLGPLLGALRFEMEEAPRLMGSRAR